MKRLGKSATALIGFVCGIVVTVGEAHAYDSEGDWRLSTELGFVGHFYSHSGLGGIGSLGSLGGNILMTPTPMAGFERRMGDHWWLHLGLGGTYSDSDNSSSTVVTGSLGIRYLLNPFERVRIGFSVSADGFRARHEWESVATKAIAKVQSLGLNLGMSVDVALTDDLDVRFSLSLVRAGVFDEVTSVGDDLEQDTGMELGLDMSPAIGLAVAF